MTFMKDVDGDGRADWLANLPQRTENTGELFWALFDGKTFGKLRRQPGVASPGRVNFAVDFNSDGKTDFVAVSETGEASINLCISGELGFEPMMKFLDLWPPMGSSFLVDLNGDGYLDWVTKAAAGVVYWNLNAGGRHFGPREVQNEVAATPGPQIFADVSGDGLLDLIAVTDETVTYNRGRSAECTNVAIRPSGRICECASWQDQYPSWGVSTTHGDGPAGACCEQPAEFPRQNR